MKSKASWGGSGGSCHTKMYAEWFQDNTAVRQQEGQPKGERFSIQGALKKQT